MFVGGGTSPCLERERRLGQPSRREERLPDRDESGPYSQGEQAQLVVRHARVPARQYSLDELPCTLDESGD